MALRLRRLGAQWVQTLKTGAVRAAFARAASGSRRRRAPATDAPARIAAARALKAHSATGIAPLFTALCPHPAHRRRPAIRRSRSRSTRARWWPVAAGPRNACRCWNSNWS
ncbi:MAG: hypothetical protein MZW92_43385 [Comamonadaceae bacterium]|nr:hypothetical protein [Comamonadaceae bacterium]